MINLLTLQVKLSDPSDGNIKGLKFIQDINLVASKDEYNCNLSPGCTGLLHKITCSTSKLNYIYRCSKCKKKISPTKGTWFEKSRLSVIDNLYLVFLWCTEIRNKKVIGITGSTKQTTGEIFKQLRKISGLHWRSNNFEMGGIGKVVEIDESQIFKRKANVGRLLANESESIWIVGGVERGSKNCFFQLVERRNKETLNQLIQHLVKEGTKIITDCWRGYVDLNSLGYQHETINHSINFVDPINEEINTQKIERFWKSVKGNIPKEANRQSKQEYFDEHCFKYKYFDNLNYGKRFKLILELIASHFPSPLEQQVN